MGQVIYVASFAIKWQYGYFNDLKEHKHVHQTDGFTGPAAGR